MGDIGQLVGKAVNGTDVIPKWDKTVELFGEKAIIAYPQSLGDPGTGVEAVDGQGDKYRQVGRGVGLRVQFRGEQQQQQQQQQHEATAAGSRQQAKGTAVPVRQPAAGAATTPGDQAAGAGTMHSNAKVICVAGDHAAQTQQQQQQQH
jgi:hypothetical protein